MARVFGGICSSPRCGTGALWLCARRVRQQIASAAKTFISRETKTASMPLFLGFFFLLLVFILVFILVEIEVFLFVRVVFIRLDFERGDARNLQRSATFVTGKNVAFVQFFFFHIDGGIAAGTTDHKDSFCAIIIGGFWRPYDRMDQ